MRWKFQGQRSHGKPRNRWNVILKWILREKDYKGENHSVLVPMASS